jgi:hypothetical protein
MSTNTTKKFLVVHTSEWVSVALGEKETYAFASEQPDYDSAEAERTRLNHRPEEFPGHESDEAEIAGPVKTGVSLTRRNGVRRVPRRVLANREG